ncbi:MAG: NO-inducible flavohemoprotein [Planctomycetaceae bacterium]|nr:NO-inducible flavohemoprotein [Planctomycetaceae bacterium]
MLNSQTIEIIKAVTPAIAVNAQAITRNFYLRMFRDNPEVRPFFNQAHQRTGVQQHALASAICAYFAHIENLDALRPAIEVIAQKHCSLGVQAEHYPIVGKHLLAAIKEVMEDSATGEVMEAMAESYQFLAHIFVGREQTIYEEQKSADAGWNGYRTFIVDRKVPESDVVTSFYLRRLDERRLPTFKPGQYITVSIGHPTTPTSPRNYSLSDRPDVGYFRISVKREVAAAASKPDGLISNYLHDVVQKNDCIQVGPPCGEFTIDTVDDERPIVFLAGGIGVTPLLSMAKTLVHQNVKSPIHFVHAARNSSVHPFAEEVLDLKSNRDNVQTHIFYDEPIEYDVARGKCDQIGKVKMKWLQSVIPWPNAEFYCCGPKPFMQSVNSSLHELGVDESRIHFEFFGPSQPLINAST